MRQHYFNLIGNSDEPNRLEIIEQPLENHSPKDVTEIDDASEDDEIEGAKMDHNNDDADVAINDRYKITGVNEEEYDDDQECRVHKMKTPMSIWEEEKEGR